MENVSEQVAALENALAAAERQASAQRLRAVLAERNEAMLRVRVKAAESALATARVEWARAAQAAFVAGALWADREVTADTLNTPMAEAEARRRYPAAAPVQETLVLRVRTDEDLLMQVMGKDAYVSVTSADARRIVSLAAQDGGTDA